MLSNILPVHSRQRRSTEDARRGAGAAALVHRCRARQSRKIDTAAHSSGAKEMSVRSTITSQFQQVAIEQERALSPLSDELKLVHSGLDSLSFAIIVAR